jgi:hypothetical protein
MERFIVFADGHSDASWKNQIQTEIDTRRRGDDVSHGSRPKTA